jgi:hypothetical protein
MYYHSLFSLTACICLPMSSESPEDSITIKRRIQPTGQNIYTIRLRSYISHACNRGCQHGVAIGISPFASSRSSIPLIFLHLSLYLSIEFVSGKHLMYYSKLTWTHLWKFNFECILTNLCDGFWHFSESNTTSTFQMRQNLASEIKLKEQALSELQVRPCQFSRVTHYTDTHRLERTHCV